jgi:hypothetical protein
MILGIDGGSRTVSEAEHLLHTVARALGLPADTIGCTHFVRIGEPHVACSLAVPDSLEPPADAPGALDARRVESSASVSGGLGVMPAGSDVAGGPAAVPVRSVAGVFGALGVALAEPPDQLIVSPAGAGAQGADQGEALVRVAGAQGADQGEVLVRVAGAQGADQGEALVRVAGVLGADREGPLAEGAARAAAWHAERRDGRIVTYPGCELLTGTLTVGELLASSAIDRVAVLAQPGTPDHDALLDTNDHVRPVWRDGLVTLLVMPAAGGRLMPAEVPNPTPCCADHARGAV